SLIRLFNKPLGKKYLATQNVSDDLIESLPLLGISGIANMLSAIKFAKYYELSKNDVVMTILTDSMEMYQSRLHEMDVERGEFTELEASAVFHRYLLGTTVDYIEELTYESRKRIHNLKYFTWVEQQGKTFEEIQAQWYDPHYWSNIHNQIDEIDQLINEFNHRTGLLS
ncbi:MAG: pyridoxal-5-phosphate-dependent protein subunit beta, partial [Fidelibacterota bacterium]